MAATAAAVVSLKKKIVRLLNHSQSKTDLPRSELESICEDLSYWQLFLQTISSGQSNISSWQRDHGAFALQTQIKDLAQEFDSMIDSYEWDLGPYRSEYGNFLVIEFSQKIVELKQKINLLTKTLESERENGGTRRESDTMKMVGFDEKLEKLKKLVLGGDYQIISIVGMAGIGKTTLAKELFYNNPTCLDHFQIRLFFIVGPEYEPREFLLLALSQLGFQRDEMGGKRDNELGDHLRHYLYGKMYLIVLDDIWDARVWHKIELLFPNNKNGSRIIMTTRLRNVTGHPSSDMPVPFLNDDESWDLLRTIVFTGDQESSSLWDHQLEKIGRKIAKNCEGLPLAIIEVGKILCKTDRTVESWMEIAEREDPLVIKIDDGTFISNTLSLSYIKLPRHLKSCFMYMGVFRKNYKIPTIKLINLWISEGFITQPLSNESLEKVAEGYLDDLAYRSLVLVCKGSSSGRIKTCRIHFVYRNICISEAKNENLFDIIKKYPNSFPERQSRLCFHNISVLGFKQVHNRFLETDSDPRSLLVFGPQHQHPLRLYLHFPSLKVLDAVTIRFYKFPHQAVGLVELRYLAITYDGEIPPTISRLCKLEVLIVLRHHESLRPLGALMYLPMGIWELRKLRHLQCIGYDLPDPTKYNGSDNGSHVILENLSTLSGVSAHSCFQGVLQRMPNLTKLGIQIHEYFSLYDEIKYLDRLESFKCIVKNPGVGDWYVFFCPYFPVSIRKITLSGCGCTWGSMTDMWNLQKLEVLKLKRYAFCGPEWKISVRRRFTWLRFLLLEDLDIEHWMIDSSCFPILRILIIRHCYKLRDIPSCLGFRSSLQMLEVDDCSPSLVTSAQHIRMLQQQKYDNKSFQLRIHSSWDDKVFKRHR